MNAIHGVTGTISEVYLDVYNVENRVKSSNKTIGFICTCRFPIKFWVFQLSLYNVNTSFCLR